MSSTPSADLYLHGKPRWGCKRLDVTRRRCRLWEPSPPRGACREDSRGRRPAPVIPEPARTCAGGGRAAAAEGGVHREKRN